MPTHTSEATNCILDSAKAANPFSANATSQSSHEQ